VLPFAMRVGVFVVIVTALLFSMRMRMFLAFVRMPLLVAAASSLLMWMRVFPSFWMRMMVLVFLATHDYHLLLKSLRQCADVLLIRLL